MEWLSKLLAFVGGAQGDQEREVERLRLERAHRRGAVGGVINPRADLDVARSLAATGRLPDALVDLQNELRLAEEVTAREFAQCTAKEKRGLVAMKRSEVFGLCANLVAGDPMPAVAYTLMSHAWRICGLATYADSKAELQGLRSAASWQLVAAGSDAAPDLVAWAVAYRPLRTADDVNRFAADLWLRLGLPEESRLKA